MGRLAAFLHLFCLAISLQGAGPTLDHLYPMAVQAGVTNSISVIGKFDPWPPKVWVDAPGIVFKPETNSGKCAIEIDSNSAVGPHLVRVFNEQGVSEPRFLIVTREAQIQEQEPNDEFAKPQLLERLPASLNGRLDKAGDVDCFGVSLKAGQTLIASVDAYILASPMDAVLRLVDARGGQLALNHDHSGTLDPFLTWTAKDSGDYVLQVFAFAFPFGSDVRFTGGNSCVYRLHVARGPCLGRTIPLGVQYGARNPLRLGGVDMTAEL